MATNNARARAARAHMAQNPGMKYTQALRAVDTSSADARPAQSAVVIPRFEIDPASGPLLITGPGKTTLARLILAQSEPRAAVYLHQTDTGDWSGLNPHTGETVTAADLQRALGDRQETSPVHDDDTTAPAAPARRVVVVDDLDQLMSHPDSEYAPTVLVLLGLGRGLGITVIAAARQPTVLPGVALGKFGRKIRLLDKPRETPGPGLGMLYSGPAADPDEVVGLHVPYLDAQALAALGTGSETFSDFVLAPAPQAEPERGIVLISGPCGSDKTIEVLASLETLAPAVLIHAHGPGLGANWTARRAPGGEIIPAEELSAHIAAGEGLTVAVDDLPGLLSPTDPAMSDPVMAEAVLSVIEQARAGRLSLVITAVDPRDLPESLRGAITDRLDLSMDPTGAGRARIAAMSQLGRPTEEYPIPERTREEVQGLYNDYGYTGMF